MASLTARCNGRAVISLQTVALTYLELLLKEKEFGLMFVTMSKVIKVLEYP